MLMKKKLVILHQFLGVALTFFAFWVAILLFHHQSSSSIPWVRWDSSHYLSISSGGYQAVICSPFVCGNTGWFPLYPALIFFLRRITFLPPDLVALFVSLISSTLVVMQIFALARPRYDVIFVALALSVLPGSIYLFSVFPLSFSSVFVLAYIYALKRRSLLLASLAAFLAVASYPSAVLIFAAPLIFFLNDLQAGKPVRLEPYIAASASPWISYIATKWLIDWLSGIPRAYSLTQARYGHSIGLGFETLRTSVRYFYKNPIYLQSLIVFFLLLLILIYLFRSGALNDPVSSSFFVYAGFIFLAYQLYGDTVSSYRQEAMIAPAFLFFACKLSLPWLLIGVAMLFPVSLVMLKLFFAGVLV